MNKKSCVAGIDSCQDRQVGLEKNMEGTKMKNKMYSLPLVTAFMLLMLAGIVSAGTCTFVSPAASAVVSGASNTLIINTTVAPVQNCTVTAASTLSGDSFTVGTFTNSTNVTFNGTYSTASGNDASDWIFTATCVNSTGATKDTCTRTGITIDNTVPTITGCLINGASAASGSVGSSDQTFACTIKNATSCNAYWKTSTALLLSTSGSSRTDMSTAAFTATSSFGASGVTATAYLKSVDDDAKNAYFACTDGRNTTTGTTYAISLDGYSKTQESQNQNAANGGFVITQNAKNDKTLIIIIAGAVVALLLVIVAYSAKKK